MSFSVQFRPTSIAHYVLTALVGMDGELYWFTWDLARALSFERPHRAGRNIPYSVQVRHIAGSLQNVPRRFMHQYVINHALLIEYLSIWPEAEINDLGRKLVDPNTRIRILLDKSYGNFDIPSQILICDDGPELFAVWYAVFKADVMEQLYQEPPVSLSCLLRLLTTDGEEEEDEGTPSNRITG